MSRRYAIYETGPEARAFSEGVQLVNEDTLYVENIYRTQGLHIVKLEDEDGWEHESLKDAIKSHLANRHRTRKPKIP